MSNLFIARYESCKFDKFCSDGTGDFFSCAISANPTASPHVATPKPTAALPTHSPSNLGAASNNNLSSGAIAGIAIASIAIFFLVFFVVLLVWREKKGSPMFASLLSEHDAQPIARASGTSLGRNRKSGPDMAEGGTAEGSLAAI